MYVCTNSATNRNPTTEEKSLFRKKIEMNHEKQEEPKMENKKRKNGERIESKCKTSRYNDKMK